MSSHRAPEFQDLHPSERPSVAEYDAQRRRELQPLADALAIHVRGATDARIEQTGGFVYCATVRLGAWTVYADEAGWSIEREDGSTVAVGQWDESDLAYMLTNDDSGALDADECDAAAVTFAATLAAVTGVR